jgi:hypothetical protein
MLLCYLLSICPKHQIYHVMKGCLFIVGRSTLACWFNIYIFFWPTSIRFQSYTFRCLASLTDVSLDRFKYRSHTTATRTYPGNPTVFP